MLFIDLVKEKVQPIVKIKGYALIKESKTVEPDSAAYIVFFKLYHRLTISQVDSNENHNIYTVTLNNKKLLEVDIDEVGTETALASIVDKVSKI
ncbi:MAG: hypothetical protein M0D57_11210 [Sphingobacteriales bacterium JAD_PAG50586_3]|nr:MAG: hypothetical protein M0D57_11210 [Sphingobacteriales bacterium JAD_PAG50586_3]